MSYKGDKLDSST